MKKTLVNLTDELRTVLESIVADTGQKLGPTIERLLRESPEVAAARKSLKIKWQDRTGPGNRSKVTTAEKK